MTRWHTSNLLLAFALGCVACGSPSTGDTASAGGQAGASGSGSGAGGGTGGTPTGGGGAGAGGSGGDGAGGSGGDGLGGWGGDPLGPCPSEPPQDGSACGPFDIAEPDYCYYDNACGVGDPVRVECVGEKWVVPTGVHTCEACPSDRPKEGVACQLSSSATCSYPGSCCTDQYRCEANVWKNLTPQCAPKSCPLSPPVAGTNCQSCEVPAAGCSYDLCYEQEQTYLTATCLAAGMWTVSQGACPT